MFSVHTISCHCYYILSQVYFKNKLKLALIGQSLFGQEVYRHLQKEGHRVVGVFTVPDKDGKADPLGKCILGCWVKHSQGWLVIRAAFAALHVTSIVKLLSTQGFHIHGPRWLLQLQPSLCSSKQTGKNTQTWGPKFTSPALTQKLVPWPHLLWQRCGVEL